MKPVHRGRFAPSPTGPLHFGSLVAALASYLDARSVNGEWLVRMENLDAPRTVAGADARILRTLEQFGFEWDQPVTYQSQRLSAYRAALDKLRERGLAYPCCCTRREMAGSVYAGTCRAGMKQADRPHAWRVMVADNTVHFEDRLLGPQQQNVARETGDFVVLRADGLFAYQLAVVVDDAAQGITSVVRGADLLDSTPRQIHLQRLLGLPQPAYLHVPVATNAAGEKLSKQTLAKALDTAHPVAELSEALRFLGQVPLEGNSPAETLRAAIANWQPAAIPRRLSVPRE